ncbi:MAG TPA: ABC transporter substrate-binding protein [Nitrososphaera sp.]|nr:ABC transporter substrate-binding protein [Nitrososphaera sp.]
MNNAIKFGIAGAIIAAVIASSLALAVPSQNSDSNANDNNTPSLAEKKTVRIGYFPNINHAQAVIGLGNGDFQETLGENIEVKTQIFNAGPSVIEAMLANHVDISYIGPNPAINGYVVSNGELLRVVAGATSGGAVFVVRNDAGIDGPEDFANKKFSSPQLGNTQDVALRQYLLSNGYQTKENGGNVEVLPAKNADIVTLMLKKDIHGAWVPEPWGAKLVKEANSKILIDERDLWPNGDFVTAHIIVRTDYLQKNPDVVKKVLEAHVEETEWINANQDDAMKAFNVELKKLTGSEIPEDEFAAGFSRMTLTYDPIKSSLFKSAEDAHAIGFLKENPDLGRIYDLNLLNQVLQENGLPVVE